MKPVYVRKVDDRKEGWLTVLGIDVGKTDFHCALIENEGKPRLNSLANSKSGFDRLQKWLANQGAEHVHACLESTGCRSENLAFFLHAHGHCEHRQSIANQVVWSK